MSWSKIGVCIFWLLIGVCMFLLGGTVLYYIFAILGVGIPFIHSVLLFALFQLLRALTG
ncbi:hypothetical protein [Brevibacillus laterosporus]|uniref:hypothetical protein n=1 Tax=Brevibacillus laterosporus TaxID=1465 RepID=UPI0015E1D762|nr:hypothetical protein [Brevibacillus laterosporus]